MKRERRGPGFLMNAFICRYREAGGEGGLRCRVMWYILTWRHGESDCFLFPLSSVKVMNDHQLTVFLKFD